METSSRGDARDVEAFRGFFRGELVKGRGTLERVRRTVIALVWSCCLLAFMGSHLHGRCCGFLWMGTRNRWENRMAQNVFIAE